MENLAVITSSLFNQASKASAVSLRRSELYLMLLAEVSCGGGEWGALLRVSDSLCLTFDLIKERWHRKL